MSVFRYWLNKQKKISLYNKSYYIKKCLIIFSKKRRVFNLYFKTYYSLFFKAKSKVQMHHMATLTSQLILN